MTLDSPLKLGHAQELGTISKSICSIENPENSLNDIGWEKHSHSETLKTVFEKIRSHGCNLNKSKCQIAINELVFLVHIISRDDIETDSKKVRPITNLPQPTNKTELQMFCEMLS